MREAKYGELQSKKIHPEAYKIWLTRNDELPDFELDCISPLEIQASEPLERVFQMEIMQMVYDVLPTRMSRVLAMRACGATLEDIAVDLGITRERVRQMEMGAIRKVRSVAFREKVLG